jgi:uncharacterized protein
MKVAITGATGLIGSALSRRLQQDGHEVMRLVRRAATAPGEISWDPSGGRIDAAALEGMDAVVHLAGAGVGDKRWTDAYKRQILDSRVHGTSLLSTTLAGLAQPPSVLVSASAIGYYGDTGDDAVDEDSPAGSDFLADVCVAWEAAADPARAAGIRVVHPRTGLVIAPRGGAWGRLTPIVKAGIGGRLGSGRQWWSWITLSDEIAALRLLIDSDLSGPVNLTAPLPATNAEVIRAMGEVLRRPTVLPVPAIALTTLLGEFSTEILGSHRVLPRRLTDAGFAFAATTITEGLRLELARR